MNELTRKYSQKLKFDFCEDTLELYKRLSPLNEPIAKKITKIINDRADKKSNLTDQDFYKTKNFSLPISLIVTGCYDYDFIQKLLSYVEYVKDEVGKNVLFIGCDCGVETCFLASIRPDINVTGIDICGKAIVNAKKLAKKLELKNVTFLETNGSDLAEKYDTVFSIRVAHENGSVHATNYAKYRFSTFEERQDKMAIYFNDYAAIVSHILSSNGTLYSIERLHELNLLGWMAALKKNDIYLTKLDDFSIAPGENEFSLIKANKLVKSINLASVWLEYQSKYMICNKPEYYENEADVFLFLNMGDLVAGYYFFNSNQDQVFKLCLYTNKNDKAGLLYYVCSSFQGKNTMKYVIEQKDDILELMKSDVINIKKDNPKFICYRILMDENNKEKLILD